jgi:transcriptional regulator with XRE-family HTH domain
MNLKKIALEKRLDAHKLSNDLNISYTYADLLLKSKRTPSVKVMKKFREVYKIPLGDY